MVGAVQRGVAGAWSLRQGLLSEGREAGEVGRWLENPPGKNFSPRLALTGSSDWLSLITVGMVMTS